MTWSRLVTTKQTSQPIATCRPIAYHSVADLRVRHIRWKLSVAWLSLPAVSVDPVILTVSPSCTILPDINSRL